MTAIRCGLCKEQQDDAIPACAKCGQDTCEGCASVNGAKCLCKMCDTSWLEISEPAGTDRSW